jgi:chaperonin cofactor prefoldin
MLLINTQKDESIAQLQKENDGLNKKIKDFVRNEKKYLEL